MELESIRQVARHYNIMHQIHLFLFWSRMKRMKNGLIRTLVDFDNNNHKSQEDKQNLKYAVLD